MVTDLETTSRLDRLTTRCLAQLYRPDSPTIVHPQPAVYAVLARRTVASYGGMGRGYRREAAVQHLFGAVLEYTRLFAPRHGWRLVTASPETARLRWTHPDPGLPDVVDLICATGHPDTTALYGEVADTTVVLRLCDLAERANSLLRFPDEDAPVRWCAADDPIISRELAVLS